MATALPFPTARLNDGHPRAILYDSTKCIACRQCVEACKDWNDLPRGSAWALSSATWITIEPPVPSAPSLLWGRHSCRHCDYPICATVCPVEAITKYDEGPVVIDRQICIRCQYCAYACPWGVISMDAITGRAAKCTMCSDRLGEGLEPFCVHVCPVGALEFGLRTEMEAKAEARAQETGGHVHGRREAGGTRVLYMLAGSPQAHGLREVGPERYPLTHIPLALKITGPLTFGGGMTGKLRAIKSIVVHPGRLKYRYWPWRRPEA